MGNQADSTYKSFLKNMDDYVAASACPIYYLSDHFHPALQDKDLESYRVNRLFHYIASYRLTGLTFQGLNKVSEYLERGSRKRNDRLGDWLEDKSKQISKPEAKIGTAFLLITLAGVAKETIIDSHVDHGDLGLNYAGFFSRVSKEYSTEIVEQVRQRLTEKLPTYNLEDKI